MRHNACILIAQNDPFFFSNCYRFFSQYNMRTVSVENRYKEVMSAIATHKPDVILLDAFIPPLSSIDVMKATQFLPELDGRGPSFFVLSCINDSQLKNANIAAGAFEYLLKPIDNYIVLSRIFNVIVSKNYHNSSIDAISLRYLAQHNPCTPNDLISLVEHTLTNLKIPSTLIGYEYLCKSILYYILNASPRISLTKQIYPMVAKAYGSSPACVERSIRHAIGSAWQCGNNENMANYFNEEKPTNMQFIILISKRLTLGNSPNICKYS